MKEKHPSIMNKIWPLLAIVILLLGWQGVCSLQLVDSYMLPSPVQVVTAFVEEFFGLMEHAGVTLAEGLLGLLAGVALGFLLAVCMDYVEPLYQAVYPLIVLSQTVPAVAIAPLLVLWFGYGMVPKIILIVITTFFPIVVGLLTGFRTVDPDAVDLLKSMGANKWNIFWYLKFPGSLGHFFSGLRISASYAVVGGVISEWIGGFKGLGVYMTRVKQAYAFDKMFAVIFLVSVISLLLIGVVDLIQKKSMPWLQHQEEQSK